MPLTFLMFPALAAVTLLYLWRNLRLQSKLAANFGLKLHTRQLRSESPCVPFFAMAAVFMDYGILPFCVQHGFPMGEMSDYIAFIAISGRLLAKGQKSAGKQNIGA